MIYAELKDINFNGEVLDKSSIHEMMRKNSYYLPLYLSIGIKGKEGADYFNVDVFNVGWVNDNKIMSGLYSIIVDFHCFNDLESYLNNFINSLCAKSEHELWGKLRLYFEWEYENIKMYGG